MFQKGGSIIQEKESGYGRTLEDKKRELKGRSFPYQVDNSNIESKDDEKKNSLVSQRILGWQCFASSEQVLFPKKAW